MVARNLGKWLLSACALWAIGALSSGCHSASKHGEVGPLPFPRELDKVSLPDYVIEPPDVLVLDTLRVVPLPPYHIDTLDAILIQVSDALPDQPISGLYPVDPEGTVNLGFNYGSVRVVGMTLAEARDAITKHLQNALKPGYQVNVALGQTRAQQQIRGEHLVRLDGKVTLGTYGSVRVAGLTIEQARSVIEAHLSQFLQKPEVSVDIAGFNSKVFYLIIDGAGLIPTQVSRFPITGNETVLDALSGAFSPGAQTLGIPAISARDRIWVARPGPADMDCEQILPVDWRAIIEGGRTRTNYQLLPGDRIYVQADRLIKFDTYLARVLQPIERILGVQLLLESVIEGWQSISRGGTGTGGTGGTGLGGL
jgi:polysaccharide export outer membrane protein